ncbi:OpgC domain-containing protein [Methylocella sp. CPCC 101449]|uniref:OpgC family protein n=1 Tax=Methylocella sp. CPCC 101449 TaxID=2987531 RepID=UPI00288E64BA|nr:OpgC domain-containing protein [Methylocella sp. CPCC 101449]MDT2023665.1 OpgC domain-containing protein [Methylocella sp. CPCC 101449]
MDSAITPQAKRVRDPRLDFFRGIGMFIIFVAHTPDNFWAQWIPARFGFSDAADLFVFCSGMASAIAFGGVFAARGWLLGAARIVYRVWQVYWAHIGSFVVVVSFAVAMDHWLGTRLYAGQRLGLDPFFADAPMNLARLATLTYVPDWFDILPMYLVLLAMIPIVMALAIVSKWLVAVFVLGLWLSANVFGLNLIADPTTGRLWYFNPFGWALIFFTGFALMRGWLPTPPVDRRLVIAAAVFVVLLIPPSCQMMFACESGWGSTIGLNRVYDALAQFDNKTSYGPLRYIHFLATAYLAWVAVGEGGRRLTGAFTELMRRVGQQTLAVFLTGLFMAQACGMLMDWLGRGFFATTLVNLFGLIMLTLAALAVHWFKSNPWHQRKTQPVPAKLTGTQITTPAPGRIATAPAQDILR